MTIWNAWREELRKRCIPYLPATQESTSDAITSLAYTGKSTKKWNGNFQAFYTKFSFAFMLFAYFRPILDPYSPGKYNPFLFQFGWFFIFQLCCSKNCFSISCKDFTMAHKENKGFMYIIPHTILSSASPVDSLPWTIKPDNSPWKKWWTLT